MRPVAIRDMDDAYRLALEISAFFRKPQATQSVAGVTPGCRFKGTNTDLLDGCQLGRALFRLLGIENSR
jgi:hypothetical protein